MTKSRNNTSLPARVIRFLVMAVNLLACGALIASAFGGRVNPLTNAWGGIAAMTFPLCAVAVIMLLLVNLCWFRRVALLDIAALAICTGPLLSLCPLNFNRPSMAAIESMGDTAIKVMTFNVYNFIDIAPGASAQGNRTVAYILEQDADVNLLQEAFASLHSGGNVSSDEINALKARYPYIVTDGTGLCLLSKFPVETVRTDIDSSPSFAAARYDVEIGGRTVHFFNIHLQSIGLTDDDKQLYRRITKGEAKGEVGKIRRDLLGKLKEAMRLRASQADQVRAEIEKAGEGPVILGGDFNDVTGCYALRKIMSPNLRDAYRTSGLGPAITYHVNRFYFRIDHFVYGDDVDALRTWTGSANSSDHYPLLAYFRLTPVDSITAINNQSNITKHVKTIINPGCSGPLAAGLNPDRRHGS